MEEFSPAKFVLKRAKGYVYESCPNPRSDWPQIVGKVKELRRVLNSEDHRTTLINSLDIPETAWDAAQVAILEYYLDYLVAEYNHTYYRPKTGKDESGKTRLSDAEILSKYAEKSKDDYGEMVQKLSPGARRLLDGLSGRANASLVVPCETIENYSNSLMHVAEKCQKDSKDKGKWLLEIFVSDLFLIWDAFRVPFALWRHLRSGHEISGSAMFAMSMAKKSFENWEFKRFLGIVPPLATEGYREHRDSVLALANKNIELAEIIKKPSRKGREKFVSEILDAIGITPNPKLLTSARKLRPQPK